MKFIFLVLSSAFLLVSCSLQSKKKSDKELPPIIPTPQITHWSVSGISSGAMMSAQIGMAHSQKIKGIGLMSSTTYGCSEGSLEIAKTHCMANPDKISTTKSLKHVQKLVQSSHLDPIENIEHQKVFLFHGQLDPVVKISALNKNKLFYTKLKATVKHKILSNLGHSIATKSHGSACEKTELPFLGNCNYDSVDEILGFILPLNKQNIEDQTTTVNSKNIYTLDLKKIIPQEELMKAFINTDLQFYVPQACLHKNCPGHIAFHGCLQSPEFVTQAFIEKSGYLQAAEKYNAIIFFPSVIKTPNNPNGCWDWWGYTGSNFDTKEAPQIRVLNKIIENLTVH